MEPPPVKDIFGISGPFQLTTVDWENTHQTISVNASLVQAVYVLERDRQHNRLGPQALAPPWWESFNFQLHRLLIDDVDNSIYGAIFELKTLAAAEGAPRYVIAFRGTNKGKSHRRDLKLDLKCIENTLDRSNRYKYAMQIVQNMVAAYGASNVWLAGHSLGSAIGMLVGKNMAKMGIFVEAFLFNPPFISVLSLFERINYKPLKYGMKIVTSFATAADRIQNVTSFVTAADGIPIVTSFVTAVKKCLRLQTYQSEDPFVALSQWVPGIFVNRNDLICSGYIGYFERRRTMKAIGPRRIERIATQNSLFLKFDQFLNSSGIERIAPPMFFMRCLILNLLRIRRIATQNSMLGGILNSLWSESVDSEPLHLLPSANLTINLSRSPNCKQAHGIHQWWTPDLQFDSKVYIYS